MVVVVSDRRWTCETKEDLLVFRLLADLLVDDGVDQEVLSNASDYWPEGFMKLPIYSIVEHVEENNCLVSDSDIWVALKLNHELLKPMQAFLIISNLRNEQRMLQLLQILVLLLNNFLCEILNIFLVLQPIELELFASVNNFWQNS